MTARLITFEDALKETVDVKRHLLLGNGFSIALFPERFRYGALLDQADFSGCPEARAAFDALGTTDFEVVIDALRRAVALLPLYAGDPALSDKMQAHAETLKELLVQAIAGLHPARPSDITEDQYGACRTFLASFIGETRDLRGSGGKDCRGHVYTLNYDLLLYWTLMHNELVRWDAADPLSFTIEPAEGLMHDDGFRAPDADPSAAYVAWDAEDAANNQNLHFLHGALHLFDYGAELQKKCWERSGGLALVDQVRAALDEGKFPLFVAEGSSSSKLERIRHSGYLQRCLRSFAGVCRTRDAALFIFGHSLAGSDEHILRQIEKGQISRAYVSLYGDVESDENKAIIARAEKIQAARSATRPLDVAFFNSVDAHAWEAGAPV